jgi:hypothetical protein
MRADLPEPFRAFVERCVPEPPEDAVGSLITQHGEIRMDDGKWRSFTAEQTFDATRPGFVWHARVTMAPLVTAVVEDAYEDGHGRLEAKVFGVLRVAKGTPGIELDRGELIRYLAELPWNPLAILWNDALRFESRPGGEIRVWAHDEASHVDCVFDAAGDLAEVRSTSRVRGDRGPTPWSGRFRGYRDLGGARVPTEADVSWDLPNERWTYWRGWIDSFAWRRGT